LAELINQALDLILISRNLERVADHATNIAKDVIFWSAVPTDGITAACCSGGPSILVYCSAHPGLNPPNVSQTLDLLAEISRATDFYNY
jgi:phosphate uptake regulator